MENLLRISENLRLNRDSNGRTAAGPKVEGGNFGGILSRRRLDLLKILETTGKFRTPSAVQAVICLTALR